MRNTLAGFLTVGVLMAGSGLAYADPVVTPRIEGSSFFVRATNNENVRYNCNISYTITHTDFGETKSDNFQNASSIGPNSSADIVRFPTAWAASSLSWSNFNAQCFKAQ